ncbi:MAG: sensor histidine kinase [Magnetococcales bacterium]|nr:sensor histidine kinase [Magnetococcales bacterium]
MISCPPSLSQPLRTLQGFWNWNLSTRLVVWSALLFLISLAGMLAITLWGIPFSPSHGRLGQVRADMFQQLSLIADLHKEHTENWLNDKQKDLEAIASTPWLQHVLAQPASDAATRQIHAYLQQLDTIYPEFDHVELLHLANKQIVSSEVGHSRPLVMDSFVRRTLLSTHGYLGRARLQEESTVPIFRIGQPVRDSHGQNLALLVASLSPKSLLKQLLDTGNSLGNSGEMLLVDDTGLLINLLRYPLPDGSHPEPMHYHLTDKTALMAAAGHEGIEEESLDYRGVPVVAVYRHVRMSPEWGMGLVVKIDKEELLQPLERELLAAFWNAVLGFLLLVSLNIFMVRKQTGQLQRLSQTAARLADQELSSRTGIRGTDEMGILGYTFDRMADRIQTAMRDLRQESEGHQRTASELAAINNELRDFAYIVSHDLRSPLLSIQGFVEELQMDLDTLDAQITRFLVAPEQDEQQHILERVRVHLPEELRYIRASADKMERLIQAILNLSRMGRKMLCFEDLDLHALVEENIQALAHAIHSTGVTVVLEPLPHLSSDRIAMEQIVGNLLGNAIKYLEPERPGRIHIAALLDEQAGELALEITDNGRGIAPEDLEKIFVLFQRVGRQDKPGDGMGLAYVRSWVRRLGGRIVCTSTLGVGTTFRVTLPITPPVAETTATGRPAHASQVAEQRTRGEV